MPRYSEASKSPSDPETAPREPQAPEGAVRERLLPFSFQVTRTGFFYILGSILLSMAAVHSGNNLLYILVATLLAAIVVSGVLARISLKQVSLSLQLPENVFVGESVSIKISLGNLKRLFPSFSILVENPDLRREGRIGSFLQRRVFRRPEPATADAGADSALFRRAAYFPMLRAGESRSELAAHTFPRRGVYRLRGFRISTRFPFGLFRRGEFVAARGEILVYPLIPEISSFFHLLPFLPGHLEGPHVGQGENLFSIRKYQESDSARTIHWKATAKTGSLMAREYAREEEIKLCLILDTRIVRLQDEGSGPVFEKAVSLAAGIAAHFLREGAGIEFLTPREYVPRGTGIDHLYRILRRLAVVQAEGLRSEPAADAWDSAAFGGIREGRAPGQILSDKVFKIILSSRTRGSFPSAVWRSSHVIFFDQL